MDFLFIFLLFLMQSTSFYANPNSEVSTDYKECFLAWPYNNYIHFAGLNYDSNDGYINLSFQFFNFFSSCYKIKTYFKTDQNLISINSSNIKTPQSGLDDVVFISIDIKESELIASCIFHEKGAQSGLNCFICLDFFSADQQIHLIRVNLNLQIYLYPKIYIYIISTRVNKINENNHQIQQKIIHQGVEIKWNYQSLKNQTIQYQVHTKTGIPFTNSTTYSNESQQYKEFSKTLTIQLLLLNYPATKILQIESKRVGFNNSIFSAEQTAKFSSSSNEIFFDKNESFDFSQDLNFKSQSYSFKSFLQIIYIKNESLQILQLPYYPPESKLNNEQLPKKDVLMDNLILIIIGTICLVGSIIACTYKLIVYIKQQKQLECIEMEQLPSIDNLGIYSQVAPLTSDLQRQANQQNGDPSSLFFSFSKTNLLPSIIPNSEILTFNQFTSQQLQSSQSVKDTPSLSENELNEQYHKQDTQSVLYNQSGVQVYNKIIGESDSADENQKYDFKRTQANNLKGENYQIQNTDQYPISDDLSQKDKVYQYISSNQSNINSYDLPSEDFPYTEIHHLSQEEYVKQIVAEVKEEQKRKESRQNSARQSQIKSQGLINEINNQQQQDHSPTKLQEKKEWELLRSPHFLQSLSPGDIDHHSSSPLKEVTTNVINNVKEYNLPMTQQVDTLASYVEVPKSLSDPSFQQESCSERENLHKERMKLSQDINVTEGLSQFNQDNKDVQQYNLNQFEKKTLSSLLENEENVSSKNRSQFVEALSSQGIELPYYSQLGMRSQSEQNLNNSFSQNKSFRSVDINQVPQKEENVSSELEKEVKDWVAPIFQDFIQQNFKFQKKTRENKDGKNVKDQLLSIIQHQNMLIEQQQLHIKQQNESQIHQSQIYYSRISSSNLLNSQKNVYIDEGSKPFQQNLNSSRNRSQGDLILNNAHLHSLSKSNVTIMSSKSSTYITQQQQQQHTSPYNINNQFNYQQGNYLDTLPNSNQFSSGQDPHQMEQKLNSPQFVPQQDLIESHEEQYQILPLNDKIYQKQHQIPLEQQSNQKYIPFPQEQENNQEFTLNNYAKEVSVNFPSLQNCEKKEIKKQSATHGSQLLLTNGDYEYPQQPQLIYSQEVIHAEQEKDFPRGVFTNNNYISSYSNTQAQQESQTFPSIPFSADILIYGKDPLPSSQNNIQVQILQKQQSFNPISNLEENQITESSQTSDKINKDVTHQNQYEVGISQFGFSEQKNPNIKQDNKNTPLVSFNSQFYQIYQDQKAPDKQIITSNNPSSIQQINQQLEVPSYNLTHYKIQEDLLSQEQKSNFEKQQIENQSIHPIQKQISVPLKQEKEVISNFNIQNQQQPQKEEFIFISPNHANWESQSQPIIQQQTDNTLNEEFKLNFKQELLNDKGKEKQSFSSLISNELPMHIKQLEKQSQSHHQIYERQNKSAIFLTRQTEELIYPFENQHFSQNLNSEPIILQSSQTPKVKGEKKSKISFQKLGQIIMQQISNQQLNQQKYVTKFQQTPSGIQEQQQITSPKKENNIQYLDKQIEELVKSTPKDQKQLNQPLSILQEQSTSYQLSTNLQQQVATEKNNFDPLTFQITPIKIEESYQSLHLIPNSFEQKEMPISNYDLQQRIKDQSPLHSHLNDLQQKSTSIQIKESYQYPFFSPSQNIQSKWGIIQSNLKQLPLNNYHQNINENNQQSSINNNETLNKQNSPTVPQIYQQQLQIPQAEESQDTEQKINNYQQKNPFNQSDSIQISSIENLTQKDDTNSPFREHEEMKKNQNNIPHMLQLQISPIYHSSQKSAKENNKQATSEELNQIRVDDQNLVEDEMLLEDLTPFNNPPQNAEDKQEREVQSTFGRKVSQNANDNERQQENLQKHSKTGLAEKTLTEDDQNLIVDDSSDRKLFYSRSFDDDSKRQEDSQMSKFFSDNNDQILTPNSGISPKRSVSPSKFQQQNIEDKLIKVNQDENLNNNDEGVDDQQQQSKRKAIKKKLTEINIYKPDGQQITSQGELDTSDQKSPQNNQDIEERCKVQKETSKEDEVEEEKQKEREEKEGDIELTLTYNQIKEDQKQVNVTQEEEQKKQNDKSVIPKRDKSECKHSLDQSRVSQDSGMMVELNHIQKHVQDKIKHYDKKKVRSQKPSSSSPKELCSPNQSTKTETKGLTSPVHNEIDKQQKDVNIEKDEVSEQVKQNRFTQICKQISYKLSPNASSPNFKDNQTKATAYYEQKNITKVKGSQKFLNSPLSSIIKLPSPSHSSSLPEKGLVHKEISEIKKSDKSLHLLISADKQKLSEIDYKTPRIKSQKEEPKSGKTPHNKINSSKYKENSVLKMRTSSPPSQVISYSSISQNTPKNEIALSPKKRKESQNKINMSSSQLKILQTEESCYNYSDTRKKMFSNHNLDSARHYFPETIDLYSRQKELNRQSFQLSSSKKSKNDSSNQSQQSIQVNKSSSITPFINSKAKLKNIQSQIAPLSLSTIDQVQSYKIQQKEQLLQIEQAYNQEQESYHKLVNTLNSNKNQDKLSSSQLYRNSTPQSPTVYESSSQFLNHSPKILYSPSSLQSSSKKMPVSKSTKNLKSSQTSQQDSKMIPNQSFQKSSQGLRTPKQNYSLNISNNIVNLSNPQGSANISPKQTISSYSNMQDLLYNEYIKEQKDMIFKKNKQQGIGKGKLTKQQQEEIDFIDSQENKDNFQLFISRNGKWVSEKEKKIKMQEEQKQLLLMKECTFKPHTNSAHSAISSQNDTKQVIVPQTKSSALKEEQTKLKISSSASLLSSKVQKKNPKQVTLQQQDQSKNKNNSKSKPIQLEQNTSPNLPQREYQTPSGPQSASQTFNQSLNVTGNNERQKTFEIKDLSLKKDIDDVLGILRNLIPQS